MTEPSRDEITRRIALAPHGVLQQQLAFSREQMWRTRNSSDYCFHKELIPLLEAEIKRRESQQP